MNIDRAGRLDMSVVKSVATDVDSRRLHPGDVLFNNTNSPVLVGKTAAVSRDGDLAFSNHMTRLRPLPELDYEFLAHHLHYLWMGGYFLHRCSKHVNQASISTDTLALSVPVVIPPQREQRVIVEAIDSYLTRLDDAVASLETVEAKLKAYRASVLKAAVEGHLVPTEASLARAEKRAYEPAHVLLARILKERRRCWEDAELARLKSNSTTPKDDKWKVKYQEPVAPDTSTLPELPEGWCWATADQVGDILLGRQRSQAYLTGRWFRPYLRVANIKDDRIDFRDVEKMDFDPNHYEKYRLLIGDILVSEGQSPHLVGQSAIYRGELSDLCFQKTLHRFRPIPGAPRSEFAQIVFRANVMLGVFKKVAPITTNIAHLTLEKFKASRFPLPPGPEQQRIEDEVERLLSITVATERQVRIESLRLGRLRQAVLKWAFEGKLVDQDPTDEPAEKLLARMRAGRAAVSPVSKTLGRRARGAA
jgi:type I restriction enzyme S subunit